MKFIKTIDITNYLDKKYASLSLEENVKILDYQIEMINHNTGNGLIPIEKIQFNEVIKLQYELTDLICIKEYIHKENVNGNALISLFKNIISVIRGVDGYLLNPNNIILKSENLFVDINKKTIAFIYVPSKVDISNVEEEFKVLVKDVVNECNNSITNNKESFINKILPLIDSYDYSIREIESNLNSTGAKPIIKEVIMDNYEESEKVEKNKEKKTKGLFSNIFNFINKENNKVIHNNESTEEFVNGINIKDNKLDDDIEYGTEIITKGFNKRTHSHILFYKNGVVTKVNINKDNFILGRLKGETDYTIDNMAVGKIHAKIVTENSITYIMDLKSKNGTFLNGERLKPNKLYSLNNGDNLVFGNEKAEYKNI